MTNEEAIKHGKEQLEIFGGEHREFIELAIKALEQQPRKITLEDVKGYCKPRCLTIISNELLYELTHPKIKALEQESITWIVGKGDAQVAVRNMPIDKMQKICAILNDEALDVVIQSVEQQPCEDTISRQAAIDAVRKNTFRLTFAEEQGYEGHVVWSAEAIYSDVIEEALLELPSVTPQQTGWIPVSERLPEKQITVGECVFSENVLGTEGYTIRKAYYNYTTKKWFDGNKETEWTEITHWMPLLEEPYKKESEADK